MDASREAVEEYRRLEAALAAFDRSAESRSGDARTARPSSGRRRSGGARKRAPRGANREAVLRAVGERPGITTAELAAAFGVEKRTLHSLLSTLTKQAQLERQELPGGQTGYRIRETGAAPYEHAAPEKSARESAGA